MCGIVVVVGPHVDSEMFADMLGLLAPRGEEKETIREEGLRAGTQRLRIVDRERAVQPWQSSDGHWVLCYNGEIFNYRQLRAELMSLGRELRSESDTEVVLESFLEWGENAVARFRGEFAFTITERDTGRTYLARDPIGVKPLYWSSYDGQLNVASEIKALVPVGAVVSEVPPGHHGWASPDESPELSPYIDLSRLGEDEGPIEDPAQAIKMLRLAVEDSIRVRLDTDLPVGVILSGGLDSSLIMLHVKEMHPDCVAFTIGAPGSEDLRYARRLATQLGVEHEVIELRPGDIHADEIREAIWMSELTEYGDIINAVVSVPLFRRIRDMGIKVVLTGDGSDELFGGYQMYNRVGPESSQRLLEHMISNLYRTELQRVDRASMGNGVEARVPYLDLSLVELALRIPLDMKTRDGQDKWILRQAFADILPAYIQRRPKNPMSHASGLHERARLYKRQFATIQRSFGYDLLEPVRRDFSVLLSKSGHNLDRAIAASEARLDYTRMEHARDLAGALRWNASSALRGMPPRSRPAGRHAAPR